MRVHILVIQGAGEGAYAWDMPLIDALRMQLGEGYEVHFPRMPREENPNYQDWAHEMEHVLASLHGPVILLGHSLGGSIILKYLSEHDIGSKFLALLLVSVPFWGEPEWEAEEFQLDPRFAASLKSVKRMFFYHSKDDPVVPFQHLSVYRKHLPAAFVRTFDGAGHEMIGAVPKMVEDIRSI